MPSPKKVATRYWVKQAAKKEDPIISSLLSIFHHTHHEIDSKGKPVHEVHHCGGEHAKNDPTVDYTIDHCPCGLHTIDKQNATGHATAEDLDLLEVPVRFSEMCPSGSGWHIESGKVSREAAQKLAQVMVWVLADDT